jgi:hypothetical protein
MQYDWEDLLDWLMGNGFAVVAKESFLHRDKTMGSGVVLLARR